MTEQREAGAEPAAVATPWDTRIEEAERILAEVPDNDVWLEEWDRLTSQQAAYRDGYLAAAAEHAALAAAAEAGPWRVVRGTEGADDVPFVEVVYAASPTRRVTVVHDRGCSMTEADAQRIATAPAVATTAASDDMPDPDRLEKLAAWLDMLDAKGHFDAYHKVTDEHPDEVQRDLRRWAGGLRKLRAALAAQRAVSP